MFLLRVNLIIKCHKQVKIIAYYVVKIVLKWVKEYEIKFFI
jgi:hypothetical protein